MRHSSWGLALAAAALLSTTCSPAFAAPSSASSSAQPSPTQSSTAQPSASATASGIAVPSATQSVAASGDNPATGGSGSLGAGVQKQGQAAAGSGNLDEATQKGLGYGVDEFNRRGARAEAVGRVQKQLESDPGFSYLYTRADGTVVVVGQGANVKTQAASIGAVVDSAAYDSQLPNLATLRDKVKDQVGLYGISAIGYGTDGFVVAVDPGATTNAGKKSPEDFAKQFKHVTIKRQPMATQTSATSRGGDPYSLSGFNCTAGFNGYYNGALAMITAGHCTNGVTGGTVYGNTGAALGTVTWSQWGGGIHGTDMAVVTNINTGNYQLTPEVNGNSAGIITITGTAETTPGMPVCKSGRSTGWTCGTVDYLGWIWVANGTIANGSWVWSAASQNVVNYYGDSGGPWLSGHKAVGIMSAIYDNLSYKDPVYRSTYAPITDLATYRPGAEIMAYLSTTSTFNGVGSGQTHTLSQNSTVNGYLPPLSGDYWSSGTTVHIRIPSSGQDMTVPVNSDGTYSFTYTGASGTPYIWAQAQYGSNRGGVFEVNGGSQMIAQKATSMNGRMGNARGGVFCGLRDGGCGQYYDNGVIYWSPNSGAHVVWGEILNRWAALGWENSALGYPLDEEQCGDVSGASGSVGCYQHFQGGFIFWSPASGAWSQVNGVIRDKYATVGVERGKLGFPTGDVHCTIRDGGCFQHYEGGTIYWSPNSGAHVVLGDILNRWAALGWENSPLGYPLEEQQCGDVSGASGSVGCYQHFQGGFIFWSPATGAWSQVNGVIRDKYGAMGVERGKLGFPTGDVHCTIRDGGCFQHYEGGTIYWSPNTGAHVVLGDILTRWAALGWENSTLGYPVNDQVCGAPSGVSGKAGCYQQFQGGYILSGPSGAWEQYGAVRRAYEAAGVERGQYGYPTGPLVISNGIATQTYEGGTIRVAA